MASLLKLKFTSYELPSNIVGLNDSPAVFHCIDVSEVYDIFKVSLGSIYIIKVMNDFFFFF